MSLAVITCTPNHLHDECHKLECTSSVFLIQIILNSNSEIENKSLKICTSDVGNWSLLHWRKRLTWNCNWEGLSVAGRGTVVLISCGAILGISIWLQFQEANLHLWILQQTKGHLDSNSDWHRISFCLPMPPLPKWNFLYLLTSKAALAVGLVKMYKHC